MNEKRKKKEILGVKNSVIDWVKSNEELQGKGMLLAMVTKLFGKNHACVDSK